MSKKSTTVTNTVFIVKQNMRNRTVMRAATWFGFLILSCCIGVAHAHTLVLDSLLSVLDAEITRTSRYEQQKDSTIRHLRNAYENCPEHSPEKYRLCKQLADEYLRYDSDSSYHYLKQCVNWSMAHENKDEEIFNRLAIAYFWASTGYETEAYIYMQDIARPSGGSDLLRWYYRVYWKLYSILLQDTSAPCSYNRIQASLTAYADSLRKCGITPEMDEYWYGKIDSLFQAGNEAACLDMARATDENSRQYALLTHIIASNYEQLGQEEDAMEYYARAAIADIRSTTRDHAAIAILATKLLGRGDINRAYRYIKYSYNQVALFNGKLRIMHTAHILPAIETEHQQMTMRNHRTLRTLMTYISILAIFLLFLLYVIFRQLKKISKTKDELKQTNTDLQKLNEDINRMNKDLQRVNQQLALADTIKEKYITHFIQLCSVYINDLDDYQRKVKKMAMNKNIKGIMALAGTSSFFDNALDRLYNSFDDAFLHIYPDFVNSLNALLQDDKHFSLKKDERLTTELRIYALIKLGITDYAQIADFLRCSVNTIYNYRTKLKARLKVPKEELDAFLTETIL